MSLKFIGGIGGIFLFLVERVIVSKKRGFDNGVSMKNIFERTRYGSLQIEPQLIYRTIFNS